ncbi:ParB N-terminal domain-containing protein [Pleomorphomonas koreensis]|uniref:ParB N-terminal domain-containing protein n=1 Tax=Pleomorphomonas koreensis TaxID=257440 RepID=UPI0003FFDC5A|nr:ParB N-terminal domain-containing protein [Pleomorphomonas koreensis]
MQVQAIRIADIDRSKRLRAINPDWAQALADEAREAGGAQWSPIEVVALDKGYRLISGGHRTEAAMLAGLVEIEAKVFDRTEFADEAEIRLREVRENLLRYELTALDRAIHLVAWKEIYEAANAVDRRGGDRRSKTKSADETNSADLRNRSFAERFSLAASKVLGVSEDSIGRSLKIAKGISEAVRLKISAHPIADNASELLKLSGETAQRQEKIVGLLMSDPPNAANVDEAIAIIDRVPAPKQLELWEKTSASLLRMSDTQLDRVFDAMAPKIMAWMARQTDKPGKKAA